MNLARLVHRLSAQLKKKLVSNFLYLSLSQSIGLVVPLLVTPHLVRVLGLAYFGLIMFSQSIMLLLALLVDYGFNVSGTRNIAINRSIPHEINKIFTNIMATKALMLVMAFVVLLLLLLFPKFNSHTIFYLSSFLIVAGQAFIPTWVYQGLEKMKMISFVNVVGKVGYVVLLFMLVHKPSDFIYVNILWGSSFLFTAILAVVHLRLKYKIYFGSPTFAGVINELKNGIHLFITVISINVYTYSNSAILGFFAGYEAVGIYGIAEKVMGILRQVPIIFSLVLYPSGCKAAQNSFEAFKKLLLEAYRGFVIFFLIICLFTFFLTPQVILFFKGTPSAELNILIPFFIVAVFVTSLNIPAYQTLLSFNFSKSYSLALTVCCIISIITNILLTRSFLLWGTTINVVFTEVLVVGALYFTVHVLHKPYSLFKEVKNT